MYQANQTDVNVLSPQITSCCCMFNVSALANIFHAECQSHNTREHIREEHSVTRSKRTLNLIN